MEREESLKPSQDRWSKSEHRVHERKFSRNTIDDLKRQLKEVGKALQKSEEHVQYVEDRASEQSNNHCPKTIRKIVGDKKA